MLVSGGHGAITHILRMETVVLNRSEKRFPFLKDRNRAMNGGQVG